MSTEDRKNELMLQFEAEDPPVETHVAQGWKGVSVQYSRLKLPAEYSFSWEGHTHYLAYHDLVLQDGELEVWGEKPVSAGDIRDMMTFVPAEQPLSGWAKPVDRFNAFTVLSFEPAIMEEELEAKLPQQTIQPNVYFSENVLGPTMRKLEQLMGGGSGQPSQAYVEAVALTAALETTRFVLQSKKQIPASAEISRSQRALLIDYIETNISKDIGLNDLAAACQMTRFHFSRAFKATFGDPPYKYLTRRRLELAKRLLAESRMSVAEIALACGFNGASQFARSFRESESMSPLEFRKSAR